MTTQHDTITGSPDSKASSRGAARRDGVLICAFLVAGTLAVYWRVLGFGFVAYDDGIYVYLNRHIQHGLTLATVKWAFGSFCCHNWHPLTWLSHALDWQTHGHSAGGHHLTSLLLHMASSLLLFAALSRMTKSVWRSGFVAALFALHPLHVESVAWIAERKDVLSTLFLMLTLIAYARYTEKRGILWYLSVVLAFALGLLAKPMLVSLPLLLLLLDRWPLRREGAFLVEKLPLFALAAGSCVVTYAAQATTGAAQTLDHYPVGVRIANALVSYVAYIVKMAWPRHLAVFYPHPGNTLPAWQVMGSAAMLMAVTLAAVRLRKAAPYVMVGWLWYVVTLVPVIGLVQVGQQAMADRYTYVPLIGLFIIIAWGVPDMLARRQRATARLGLAVAAAAVLLALMGCTRAQVLSWRNTGTLIRHAYESSPDDYRMRCWVALYMDKTGDWNGAYSLLSHSLGHRPNVDRVYNQLGYLLAEKRRYEEAEHCFDKAIEINPELADAHNNLGTVYLSWGRADDALGEFLEAARLAPFNAEPHFNAGNALAALGQIEEALDEYDQAATLDPTRDDAMQKAGLMLMALGRDEEAIEKFRAASEAAPDSPAPHFLLGNVLSRRGDIDQAIVELRRAVAIKRSWGPAHYALALALAQKGDSRAALREAQLAARLGCAPDPKLVRALKSAAAGSDASKGSP